MTTAIRAPEAPTRTARHDARPESGAHAEPAPYRFTVNQIVKMVDYGIFHPDDRLELIEGELIHMVPPGIRHSASNDRLARTVIEVLGGDQAVVRTQGSIQIGEGSLLVPDLALLRPRSDEYETGFPTPQDVLLVIEVSHSTLRSDRTRKLALYADAEIHTYWTLNVADVVIEAHSDPVDGDYATRQIYRPGDTITLEAFPGITINASDILLPTNQR